MWFSLAATNGNKKAARSRDLIAKKMSATKMAEAGKMAREWLKKHKKR